MRARGPQLSALGLMLLLTACALPQWRVFQKKVDGKLAEKPAAQVEGERKAAAYIVKRSEPPVANPAVAVADIYSIASGLSASLGEPARPVSVEDKDAIISSLRTGLRAKEEQLEKWKEFGRKYAGKPLEDTGINLAGPAGLLALAAVVAACIFIPGFGWVLLRLLPVLWTALKRAAGAVENLAREAPEAVARLKAALPQKEDAARRIVRLAKARLPVSA